MAQNIENYLCDGLGAPSQYITDNVIIYDLNDLGTICTQDLEDSICSLNFIHNHVGGHGTNSPRRGVYVFGNSLTDNTSQIDYTHWTASMNASHISVTTKTTPMPNGVKNVIPTFVDLTAKHFPDATITTATYCLGVANCYGTDSDHTICAHTDAQTWYAGPTPVFASITYYPDGEPEKPEYCHRFQILDEDKKSWRFLHLRHNTLCIMRSDIYHRVIPPISKYRNKNFSRRRINVTLRNLVHPSTNPLGYYQAVSNHFRYYGKPVTITMPSDCIVEDHLDLFLNYLKVSLKTNTYNEFTFIKRKVNSLAQKEEHKLLKKQLKELYSNNPESAIDFELMSKPNLVWQTTNAVIKYLSK
jgi:hypothetical protein